MPNARLLLLIVAVAFLVTVVQLGLLQVTFHKLGLAAESASLLLMVTLLGSMINLPLFTVPTDPAAQEKRLHELPRLLLRRMQVIPGKTLIAVNVGGCVVPLAFSLYLFDFSRPGLLHVLVAPLTAAIVALMLDPDKAPALAYIGGTLGVLLGADILRLKDIGKLGEPVASIGGAGTFDGIFVTGIVAVLLT